MNLVGEQESNLWLCRICLKPEGDDEFRAFYGNNCKTAIKVHKITGVKIVDATAPQGYALICSECITELTKAWSFRQKARKSEIFFRQSKFHQLEANDNSHQQQQPDQQEQQHDVKLENDGEIEIVEVKTEPIEIIADDFDSQDLVDEFEISVKQEQYPDKPADENETKTFNDDGTSTTCTICNRVLCSRNSYRDHIRAKHQQVNKSEMFRCVPCNKLFKLRSYLVTHNRKVHNKRVLAVRPSTSQPAPAQNNVFLETIYFAVPQIAIPLTQIHVDPIKPELKQETVVVTTLPKPEPTITAIKPLITDRRPHPGLGDEPADKQCKICLKVLCSFNSYRDHMRAKHQTVEKSEMFPCMLCKGLFKLKSYLQRHMLRFHPANVMKISKRKKKKRAPYKPKVARPDETIFNKPVVINCDICKRLFTTQKSLRCHMKVTHDFVPDEDKYECDYCGKKLIVKEYVWKHFKTAHLKSFVHSKKKPDVPFPCEVCGRMLKDRNTLQSHLRTHQMKGPDDYWYCDLCPRKFKSISDCKYHMRNRHVKKLTFPCTICDAVYNLKGQLSVHIKSRHTKIRDAKCEICGKEFIDKNRLTIHARIHTGEKPYRCQFEDCDRAFTHQTDLRRHVWGHTGGQPLKCDHCSKGFAKKMELASHLRRCQPGT